MNIWFWCLLLGFFGSCKAAWAQNIEKELQTLDSAGKAHWQKVSYSLALSCYKKALTIAETQQDIKWQARILTFLGVIYENKGDFETSLKYHFRGLRLKEQIGDKAEISRAHLNMGIAYYSSGQGIKAQSYYEKAIILNHEAPKPILRLDAHAFYHLSTVHRKLKQYEKAEEYAQKALRLAQDINENVIVIDAQNGLGLIATEQKQFEKGRAYYQKVYDLAYQAQDWLILTNNLQHFAESYEQEHAYTKAIEYTLQSLDMARKHELKVEQQLAYQLLASLYQKKGNLDLAYQYQTKAFTLKDSLFNLQKSQQIAELTIEYETEKKTQQIQLLKKDKTLQMYIMSGLVLLMGLLIWWTIYRQALQKKLHQEQQNAATAKLDLQEAQAKMEQERYEEQISHQERELASNMMHIFQKNEMLNTLQDKLNELSPEVKAQVKPLLQDVRNTIDLDRDWDNFQRHFIDVYPNFFSILSTNFTSLTQFDLRFLAYIRMKLSNKEIAALVHITAKSVEMARYRIKKKFGLGAEESLDKWLEQF